MVTNTNDQPDILEGTTRTEGSSVSTSGHDAGTRFPACGNDSVNVPMENGASGHYFDDAVIHRLWDRLEQYKVFDVPTNLNHLGGA